MFIFSYVSSISGKFLSIAERCKIKTEFSIPNTLKSFIKTRKDMLESLSQNNIDYKIAFKDCDATMSVRQSDS